MGDIAEHHVAMYSSGRWGMAIPKSHTFKRENPSRTALAGRRYSIAEVTSGFRPRGQKLVVTDQDGTDAHFWVWGSKGITGARKADFTLRETNLSLNEALSALGRKPYTGPDYLSDLI